MKIRKLLTTFDKWMHPVSHIIVAVNYYQLHHCFKQIRILSLYLSLGGATAYLVSGWLVIRSRIMLLYCPTCQIARFQLKLKFQSWTKCGNKAEVKSVQLVKILYLI